jgi:hypothetical protein
MMNFDSTEFKEEFEKAFGKTENLTVAQLWVLVKFSKHVRGRCRNNAALNNYLARNFPHARFKQVPKENAQGEEYDGLEITLR